MHFRDKDDLLESGIHQILQSIQSQPRASSTPERVIAFSLPLLKHIDAHGRASGPRMKREGRLVTALSRQVGDIARYPHCDHRNT